MPLSIHSPYIVFENYIPAMSKLQISMQKGLSSVDESLNVHFQNIHRPFQDDHLSFYVKIKAVFFIGDSILAAPIYIYIQLGLHIPIYVIYVTPRAYYVNSKHIVGLLTHWDRVTYICVSYLTIIGPDDGLSPGRRQVIIWNNAGILLIGPWGTNFSKIVIGIQTYSFKKMHLKMSSAKWRPFCLGLNVLSLLTPLEGKL